MQYKQYILFIFCIITLASCEEKIDLKLDSSFKRIVVEGSISTEVKSHQVRITTSSSYFFNQAAPAVTGAKVSISDDMGNTFPLTEAPAGSGIYVTAPNVKGISGHKYSLLIENVDIDENGKSETYSASSFLKKIEPMDSISVVHPDGRHKADQYIIRLWATEPATTGDYYQWLYYKNDTLVTDTITETTFLDDQLINGNNTNGLPIFRRLKAKLNDTIVVESRAIDREYYEFLNSLMTTSQSQGGFGGPPANIKTNISNGGLGFFYAYDVVYNTNFVIQPNEEGSK